MRLTTIFALVSCLSLCTSAAAAQYGDPPPPPDPPPTPAGQPPAGQPPAGQPPAGQPPPGQPPPPSAGGLTAPGPMTPPPPQGQGSEADKDLDESEEDDSERGLTWFWIDVEGGFQHVGLETFEVDKSNLTAGFVPTEASGGFIGAGIGARLLFLTLGPRARIGFYENWQLFSIGGELGFRFQLGILEPHFELGGGYAALGNVGGALSGVADSVNIDGAYGRISGGLDFFLGNVLSIGAAASWEFMGLTRPGVQLGDLNQTEVESLDDAEKQALEAEGSGYGSAVSLGGKLGLHF